MEIHVNVNHLTLDPWHDAVSIDGKQLVVEILDNSFSVKQKVRGFEIIHGWYAKFHEGVFVFFEDYEGYLNVGWKKSLCKLLRVSQIDWISKTTGRQFTCLDENNDPILDVSYQTLRRFLFNPSLVYSEVFLQDDDWGLVADLPSFVHSGYNANKLRNRFSELLTRENSDRNV
jgi:hypothetical protein